MRYRVDPALGRPRTRRGFSTKGRPVAGGATDERTRPDGPPRGGCAARPARIDGGAPTRPLVHRCAVRWTPASPTGPRRRGARAAGRQHLPHGPGDGAACTAVACRLGLGVEGGPPTNFL